MWLKNEKQNFQKSDFGAFVHGYDLLKCSHGRFGV